MDTAIIEVADISSAKMAPKSGLTARFTFLDIKAKGISGHDTKASGHRNKKMQAVYDRKPGVVLPAK